MGNKITNVFSNIITEIRNDDFRAVVQSIAMASPDYIIITPASSTGKYHPEDEIGEAGMTRHINRCAVLAKELVRMQYGDEESHDSIRAHDILLAASLLHDIFKQGLETKVENNDGIKQPKSKFTVKNHPGLIYNLIVSFTEKYKHDIYLYNCLWDLAIVCLFHEGRWTTEQSKELVDKTKINKVNRELARLMHTVDFVVSRRTVADIMQYEVDDVL